MKTMRNIPVIIPYFTQEESLKIAECLKSGWVAQGPRVAEFEKAVAAYEGTGYGVATTSWHDCAALLMGSRSAFTRDRMCWCLPLRSWQRRMRWNTQGRRPSWWM